MKKIYFLAVLVLCILNTTAQTVWNGPTMTFTKASMADWTLEENQDRITENVWLTRQNNRSLFNIKVETSDADGDACTGPEPSGTEWAYGTTASFQELNFVILGELNDCDFEQIVDGQDIVLHLIAEDIYIDFKFTQWSTGSGTGNGGGGGFAYERSTDATMDINNISTVPEIKLTPNPAADFIQISAVQNPKNYTITNAAGATVTKSAFVDGRVDITSLTSGMYFLKVEGHGTVRFIKE